jgi:Domain of unknown function (DUF5615)
VKIRLYLDEDTESQGLLTALRSRGVDVISAAESGMTGASDEEQLAFSAASDRVLYTFNRGDFLRLHTAYLVAGNHHAGLIVALQQRYRVGEQMRRLLRLIADKSVADMRDNVEFLSTWG